MHINDWIEIDKEYKWYIDEKARVIEEQGMFTRRLPFMGHPNVDKVRVE